MIDRTTAIGLAATVGLLLWMMAAGAGYALDVFWRTPSLCLVLGGSMLVTLVAFPIARFRSFAAVLKNAIYIRTRPPAEVLSLIHI